MLSSFVSGDWYAGSRSGLGRAEPGDETAGDKVGSVDPGWGTAYLAAVVGGVSRYHTHHAVNLEQIRITMPINLRLPGDPAGSNRFTPARFALPVSTVDAGERMRQLGQLARNWRTRVSPALNQPRLATLVSRVRLEA